MEESTVENTENIRAKLPKIFYKYRLTSILDAPCDDFNWMKFVTGDASINSIGGDIIRPMVERNKEKYF